ncbi:MAG: sigma-70 family RNA polymerase sigma factor [Odoribacteraceae bacterium]|jgi:RNA polymerase sigma-70 factor (ECF subfamily)|nr:sigma-70 family RNA polymerase sigma factor [Odoribacteraceae bacterium]
MNRQQDISISRLRTGDERELERFYDAYFVPFVSFANSLLPSGEESKDLVHDVFASYWDARRDFRDLISVRAFFYRSIRNKCLNVLRHEKIKNAYTDETLRLAESDEHLFDVVLKREAHRLLHAEIRKLTPMEQRVLLLSLDGKSNDDIATELGIALSTVKSHKAKSYAELRDKLKYLRFLLLLLHH